MHTTLKTGKIQNPACTSFQNLYFNIFKLPKSNRRPHLTLTPPLRSPDSSLQSPSFHNPHRSSPLAPCPVMMRTNSHLILAILLYTIYQEVSTLPDNSCESESCWNLDPLWGALIQQFKSFPGDDRKLDLPQAPPEAPPVWDPDIELQVVAPSLQPDECKVYNAADSLSSSSSEEDNSGGGTNIRQCEQAVAQMIWPTDCRNTEQNDKMAAILSGMDGQFGAVVDPLCEVKDGVMFWFAKLVTDQIATIKAQTDAIKAVFANPPYNFGKINLKLGEAEAGAFPAFQRKRSAAVLKKRTQAKVVEQRTNDDSLRFLSTAPGKPYSKKYSYFSGSGEGVVIYMIDTGLSRSREFQGSSIRWLYAVGSLRSENDQPPPISSREPSTALYQDGTCVGSKILGRSKGVAKNAQLVVVKTRPNLVSFASAVALIIEDIRVTMGPGSTARGRVVVNIRGGYIARTIEERITLVEGMKQMFDELVVSIQAIVVVSAGENLPDSPSGVIDSYPALYSMDFCVFTVGAVIASAANQQIGQYWPWTKGLKSDSVPAQLFAPGDGWCVNRAGTEEWTAGQGISTAIISGLAAYFLSLPDLSQKFLRSGDLPSAVLQFMQTIAYKRAVEGPPSVWNGIDSTDSQRFFNGWLRPKGGFPPP